MKKVLITGVAGLLGSKLADWISINEPDTTIIGIDDLSGGFIENVNKSVYFYNNSLTEGSELNDVFETHRPDYVYHFAAYAAEGLSPFIRQFNYENNLIATTRIVNQCIKYDVKKLIFTSSMATYGKSIPPFTEDMKPSPIDPYGVAKYACEQDIQIAGEQHNLNWCIFRPHNVYGDKQNLWDKYRNVLGIWMYQKLNNMPMTIYGDGNQRRAFSYIEDCVPYFWKALTDNNTDKQIFNIGGDQEYSINEACDILSEVVGGSDRIYLEQRHEVADAWSSHDKIKNILNFNCPTSLKEGLTKMWEWAQKQPSRERKLWTSYELDKGIYNFWKIK